MPELEDHDGSLDGYGLHGVWDYHLGRQRALAEAPDPRVFLVEEGPGRDALVEQDRLLCLTRPGYRRGKCTLDIDRLEAGLPVLLARRSIDTRPASRGEPPGRRSWPEARHWPEMRERSVDWFEVHPDDRVVPVAGVVDPGTYFALDCASSTALVAVSHRRM